MFVLHSEDDHLASASVLDRVSTLTSAAYWASGGYYFTCVIGTGGTAKCWGSNNSGQLGNGTTTDSPIPIDVSGLTSGTTAIALGVEHTCALDTDGRIKCWGSNNYGKLGDGTSTQRLTPVIVFGIASAVSTGWDHSCAVTSTGGAKCWGWNNWGQLGNGTGTQQLTPVNVVGLTSGVTSIAAGGAHTCALVNHGVKCWGLNQSGQLGIGSNGGVNVTPSDVVGLTNGVTALVAGRVHTCALVSGGVKCWGENSWGELGDGTTANSPIPVNVVGLSSGVTAIATREDHTCALANGTVKCWGQNNKGQLGNGTTTNSPVPVDVLGLPNGVNAIATGAEHTCVLVVGAAKCWGSNRYGQLGDGKNTDSSTPVEVVGFRPIQLFLPLTTK